MTDFDLIYDEYMESQLSNNSFVYKNPITGVVREGLGEPPLKWGEYPDGIEPNSPEANEYDMFRSNYIPLPHEVYAKENINKIKKMPEGSQITDTNWIVASKILHNYLNRSKIVPAKEDMNVSPSGTAGLSGAEITIPGNEEFKTKAKTLDNAEEYAKWGVNFMSAFDYNIAALAINVSQLNNAPENVLKSMYYLMETADREGMTSSNFIKGLFNVATDPFNLVGLGTLGIGVAGKYTGQQMTKAALKEVLKGIVLSKPSQVSGAVGAEAMLYSVVDNYARQDIKVDAKMQDGIDKGELATSAVAGAVIGERIGAGLPNVIEGARRGIVDLGKQADNYLKGTDDGATLTSGFDVSKPIAKGLSVAGKALDTNKVIDKDEYGFYSKAFEETKNLKQEKGTSQQMKQQLLKAGVKEDEMKWTGLNDLFDNNEKVTKEQIFNHLKDNRVQIKEKTLAVREEDINYAEGELNFQEEETANWINDEQIAYGRELLYDDIEFNLKGWLAEKLINYQHFGLKKADGSVEFQGDTDGMVDLFSKPVIETNPNQLTLEGIEEPKPVIFRDLLEELILEKWQLDGNLENFNDFLLNHSKNPYANKVVLQKGIVNANGKDYEVHSKLEEAIDIEAEERYYNPDYGEYIETYVAEAGDEEYKILGNDHQGYWAEENGVRIDLGNIDEYNLEEMKIALQTRAYEEGHLRYPDDEELEDLAVNETNLKFKIDGPPQYTNADWQEPGGENYREILFTNDNYKTLSGKPENVTMRHFGGYNNILAHVRVKDRVTPNGEKVLYLEEVQSDWAKIGRNQGYRIEGKKEVAQARETLKKIDTELGDRKIALYPKLKEAIIESNSKDPSVTESSSYKLMMKDVNKFGSVPTAEWWSWVSGYNFRKFLGDFNKVAYPEVEAELRSLAKLADERSNLYDSILSGTPEGPFVSDVNKWGGMVMKRIIRMAKEQGFDYVAWSPGEVQIPRYSLKQVAKELTVTKAKQPEGSNQLDTFNITAKTHGGGERNFEIKENQLNDAVGSTLATSIIEGLKKDNMVSYRGDDLEVTNPGMVGFYNKALPGLTNNLLKKILKSDARVEKVNVEISGSQDIHLRDGFKITDDLKGKVDKGFPLFTPTATTIGAGVTAKQMENNQESANGNT